LTAWRNNFAQCHALHARRRLSGGPIKKLLVPNLLTRLGYYDWLLKLPQRTIDLAVAFAQGNS
jgi:hypothetical protein